VYYRWYTAAQWLGRLRYAHHELGRRFKVSTSVIGVFNDNVDPHRYWAIVLQGWCTLNRFDAPVYEDDGFLLVNFDFDARARLKAFRIHYRLWFCAYRYDDRELGLSRGEKLARDIDRYFLGELGGIDPELMYAMRDFLVRQIQSSTGMTRNE
jgi:hypothetical protein